MHIKQPLTVHERDQILSQTGHAGKLMATIAPVIAIVASIGMVLGTKPVDWALLAAIVAIVLGAAAVFWTIITSVERGLKREVETREKIVADGRVAGLSVQETNGVNFHCLRFQPGDSGRAPLNVIVPENVYRQLHENEPVQLAHLPISNMVLGVKTKGVQWRIGDS